MHNTHRLGLVALLAAAVSIVGCDDGDGDDETGVGTNPTTNSTDPTDTDTMGETEDDASSSSSSGEDIDCSSAPTHEADLQPIWDESCVEGCHEPGGDWGSLDLTSGVAYDFLVDFTGLQTMGLGDVRIVVAGDTANSYLLNKLRGTQLDVQPNADVAGTQMPQEAPPLSDEDIDMIELWIACGAEM